MNYNYLKTQLCIGTAYNISSHMMSNYDVAFGSFLHRQKVTVTFT